MAFALAIIASGSFFVVVGLLIAAMSHRSAGLDQLVAWVVTLTGIVLFFIGIALFAVIHEQRRLMEQLIATIPS